MKSSECALNILLEFTTSTNAGFEELLFQAIFVSSEQRVCDKKTVKDLFRPMIIEPIIINLKLYHNLMWHTI